jgi:hypothetical protein
MRSYLEKTHHKKGLAEWLKVESQSSNDSTTNTHKSLPSGIKKKTERKRAIQLYTTYRDTF